MKRRQDMHRRRAQGTALEIDRLLYPEAASIDALAPRRLSECPSSRPCPWLRCRHNLYLDVGRERASGDPLVRLPVHQPWQQPPESSCVLDVAKRGPHSYRRLQRATGMSDTGLRAIVHRALTRLRTTAPDFAAALEDAEAALTTSEDSSRARRGPTE